MKNRRSMATRGAAFQRFSSHAELYSIGKRLREKCPLESHAVWRRARGRLDPLHLLEESNKGRIRELIPIRYGRMIQSPFTFYRGTALNMAADLATTPVSGLRVQACGDCHLCNFGGFATPERRVIADINDLDETLPAPWEWDVKRLAASFVLAGRQKAFAAYRKSLPEHRRLLLDRYKFQDIAVKVVGIGSVGTACAVMLMMASGNDPLFLQVKQARASVLEAYAGKSTYANHGQRVVIGCKLVQSASDLFLGWAKGPFGRHFYVRQLRDMKIKPLVELFAPRVMRQYAKVCGWILARSHARCGHPSIISGYMGRSDRFDEAIADFSMAYADQSERDHQTLTKAVRAGKVEAFIEDA